MESDQQFASLLPPEILTRIMSYLNMRDIKSASAVCQSWKQAADDNPKFWKGLKLRVKNKPVEDETDLIFPRMKFAEEIKFNVQVPEEIIEKPLR